MTKRQMKKKVVYGLIFNWPRSFLSLIDDAFFVLTFGQWNPGLYWKGVMKHHEYVREFMKKIIKDDKAKA